MTLLLPIAGCALAAFAFATGGLSTRRFPAAAFALAVLAGLAALGPHEATWVRMPALDHTLRLRLDGLGAPFYALVAFVPWWVAPAVRSPAPVLFGQAAAFLVVLADDPVSFVAGWELVAAPLFLLTGRDGADGGPDARRVAIRAATLLLAAGGAALALLGAWIADAGATTVLVLLVLALAPKVPIWPFHAWLGALAAESRTEALVLTFGWKLGGLALIRWAPRLAPDPWPGLLEGLALLGAVGALTGGALALTQVDLRRLLGAGALVHGSLVLLAWASGNATAAVGATLILFDAGISGVAAAGAAGALVAAAGTTDATALGGVATRAPRLAGTVLFALLLGVGLPGTLSFAAEWTLWRGLVEDLPGHAWVGLAGAALLVAATARWVGRALGGPVGPWTIGLTEDLPVFDRVRLLVLVGLSGAAAWYLGGSAAAWSPP